MAHEAPCMAAFIHTCNGPSVPCHSNQQIYGRGHGHKADDWAIAAACPEAHDYLDGRKGGWDRETKQSEWQRAHVATMRYFFENGKVKVA